MAFTLSLPSFGSLLRDYYPLKILKQGSDELLPCDILEIQEVVGYEIPDLPIDSGGVISDTIYKRPKQVTLRVYVPLLNYDDFTAKLEAWQWADGFEIQGLDGQKYENMRLIDKSEGQTTEANNAYFVNMSFKEVVIIEAFGATITPQKVNNGGYSGKNNKGQSATQERKKSVLKGFFG